MDGKRVAEDLGRMKCVAVSDIHLRDVSTPDADLLIVSGDMTFKGTSVEMSWFANWLGKQPQHNKVWIAGNHELGLENNPELADRVAADTKSIYLNDSEVTIDGIRIWGSPITPWFYDWAFNRERGSDIRKHWQLIPNGLDILITHGPPYGYLDETMDSDHVGCEELADRVLNQLTAPPRLHIFGHIHGGYGVTAVNHNCGNTITMINASTCNERYEAINAPVEFEILPL
jgi:Icc-related predicted phosphoesterase